MRIHNNNGKKTAILSGLEVKRLRSIAVASIKVQNLEAEGATEEEIEKAKTFLRDTKNYFDNAIRNNKH